MKRWVHLFNRIGFKIFLANTIVPIATVFLFGSFAYHYSIKLLTDNEYERINVTARRMSEQLNQYIFDMRVALGSVSGDFVSSRSSPESVRPWVDQFDYRLHTLWTDMYYMSTDRLLYEPKREPLPLDDSASRLLEDTLASPYDLHSTSPYFREGRGVVLSLSTVIRRGAQTEGVLAADLDLRVLNEIMQKINYDPNVSLLLVDSSLNPILSDIKVHQSRFNALSPLLNRWLSSSRDLSETLQVEGERMLVIRSPVGFNDWTLAFFTDEHRYLANIRELQRKTLLFSAFLAFVLILYAYNLAQYINKPIHRLIREMNRIKEGHLNTRIRLKRRDEFHTLSGTFNEMLDRIETLIDEKAKIETLKKQFELKALQYQINPHFLFNTLNSINSLLDLNRTEQIPKVIDALVQLFQHTLDIRQEWITVEQELDGLRCYVELQQIRYSGKFTVHYELEPEAARCGILKLTLQPIVENAIFHGIRSNQKNGRIVIGGRLSEDKNTLLLYVEDNGSGIPPQRLERLLDPGYHPPMQQKLKGFNSIGLRNVHERFQLYFGPDAGLRVFSKEGRGTRVEIVYPVNDQTIKGDLLA